ncbi:hypothetical protein V8G54_026191 [Vigna mungo]|uniref:Uncharacterized protein n=1 Tax=Vigna mungo TaxID=3915 RepID=A0AAQ3RMZ6_VIGMU
MECFRVLRRMGLFTFRLRFRAGITGAISVRTRSVRPNKNKPIPATPQPVPSSTARLPPKSSTRAYGLLSEGEAQRSVNFTRTREQGHTEVPTCMEPLSCCSDRTASFTGSSITGESVNFMLLSSFDSSTTHATQDVGLLFVLGSGLREVVGL